MIDKELRPVSGEIRERCRYRHKWDQVDSNHWKAAYGEPLTLRCERCGTEFRAEINKNTGGYMHKRYVYPPGYLYKRGDTLRLTTAQRRMWIVTTAIHDARKRRVARTKQPTRKAS